VSKTKPNRAEVLILTDNPYSHSPSQLPFLCSFESIIKKYKRSQLLPKEAVPLPINIKIRSQ